MHRAFGTDKLIIDYAQRRKGSLNLERSSFIPHYRDLSEFVQPRRGRFLTSDRNKGERRHQAIINSRASRAHRIARAGMFAGIMSPSRPWFKIETKDKNLMRSSAVKNWLYAVELLIRGVFAQSNLYNMAPVMLADLLLFATGAIMQVDDPLDVARFYTYPAGSYYIAQNDKNKIDTFVHESDMTVSQLVGMFGIDNVSEHVRSSFSRGEK